MKQKASLFKGIGQILLFSCCTFAQDVRSKPAATLPAGVLGSDLILWSEMQSPNPLPPAQNQETQQKASAEIFAGTIANEGAVYILKENGGAIYRLDGHNFAQDNAKKYDGRQVEVVGSLDASRRRLYIVSIRLIS